MRRWMLISAVALAGLAALVAIDLVAAGKFKPPEQISSP